MAFRPKVMYELIDRRVEEWGWRESTYRRNDGSTFHVAVPPVVEIEDGQPGRRTFNDYSEHMMAMRLAVRGDSRRVLSPGEFVLIEKVDGEWPEWALHAAKPFDSFIAGDGYRSLASREPSEILDALAGGDA